MTELNAEQLAETLARVFQEAAFLYLEQADTEAPELEEAPLIARITFTGAHQGWLAIGSTHAFGAVAAANLLGLEADDPEAEEKGLSALTELLNMWAGSLSAETFGHDGAIQLGIPDVCDMTKQDYMGLLAEASAHAVLIAEDEHRVDAALLLR